MVNSEKDGPDLLKWRQQHSEREGVRYTGCSILDAALLVRETVARLPEDELIAMELKPWFMGYKNFMLSVHCHMVRHPDNRYFNDTGKLNLWTAKPLQEQDPRLSSKDLASLGVQAPYILMFIKTRGSASGMASAAGDELPGVELLLSIALYSAWWREMRGDDGDTQKAQQSRALACALSKGASDAGACKARQQLLDAVMRANQTRFTPELRDYVGRTGNEGFFKNWTSTEMKTMALSDGVLGLSLVPVWMQMLIDKEGVARKDMFATQSNPSITPRFSLHLSPMATPRTPRVRFQDASRTTSGVSTPRTVRGYPWTAVDDLNKLSQPVARDVNFVLGRQFPQRNRVLVPAGDLNAHVEYTGWSYPEFEATSRHKFDWDANDAKNFDAAGLPRKGGGRGVVASQPGVFARSFTPYNKRDFQTSLDNFKAELFHRDSIATTQQLYLRPEVRGWGAPVPYMEAIRRTISKQL